MPELPEVETTRRGIEPAVVGRTITGVLIRQPRLRWPVAPDLATQVTGQRVRGVRRRAKYLLIDLRRGSVIVHLGMSGSLRVLSKDTPVSVHDHFDLVLDNGRCLRFNDPRRFGSLHWSDDPHRHPLLASLGHEPFDHAFDLDYLVRKVRSRKIAIKQLLMDSRIVVGVGNIYASEALYRAGIRPRRAAGRVTRAELARLIGAIRAVLEAAITAGGTTLRDYVNADGGSGYFRQRLYVYERAGKPCRRCRTPIRQVTQGGRSTYWCPTCQA